LGIPLIPRRLLNPSTGLLRLRVLACRSHRGGSVLPSTVLDRHVRVDHRRLHVRVSEQFLNRPDVVAVLQMVCRKAMTKCVHCAGFGESRIRSSRFLGSAMARGSLGVEGFVKFSTDCGVVNSSGIEILVGVSETATPLQTAGTTVDRDRHNGTQAELVAAWPFH
jgi:hypothetical protein